jgi:hypothetical protein
LEHRGRVGELIAAIVERRPDIDLNSILARSPILSRFEKVQIVVKGESLDISEFSGRLSLNLSIDINEVVLVAAAQGTLRLLLGLPQQAASLMDKGVIGNLPSIVSVTKFERLDLASQNTWRLIAVEQPPDYQDNLLRPRAVWQDVLKLIEEQRADIVSSSPQSLVLPNSRIFSSYWPEAIEILSQIRASQNVITVEAVGLDTRRHYTTSLPLAVWEKL